MSMPIPPSDDDRAERMTSNPRRYFADARERADEQVQRTLRPAPARGRKKFYARPTIGIVHMSARAVTETDLDRLIDRMRVLGFRVWMDGNGRTYEHGDGIYCRYLSVEVPEDEA